MSEAMEGCAWLEDTDDHTFVRFGQFLYTGNYSPAEPTILLDHSQIGQETTNSHEDRNSDEHSVAGLVLPTEQEDFAPIGEAQTLVYPPPPPPAEE